MKHTLIWKFVKIVVVWLGDIMVKLVKCPIMEFTKELHSQMLSHCRDERSREVCGVLLGKDGAVKNVVPIKNIAEGAHLYTMDPIELNNVFKMADGEEWEMMAIYHSHLGGPPMLSTIDIGRATLDVPIIVVTPTEAKCWNIGTDGTVEVPMLVSGKSPVPIEKTKVGIQVTISEETIKTFERMLLEWLMDGQKKQALRTLGEMFQESLRRISDLRGGDRINTANQYARLYTETSTGIGDYFTSGTAATMTSPYSYISPMIERMSGAVREMASSITNPAPVQLGGSRDDGRTIASEGGAVWINPDSAEKTSAPKSVPHDKHKFRFVSKSADGKNVYECSVENCDEVLTVNGELDLSEEKEVEENDKKVAEGNGPDKTNEPEVGGRGENSADRASDSGAN